MSVALNVIAIVVSFMALIVSVVIATRQVAIMRQANKMPLFIDLVQEFRSERFQRAELYVMNNLDSADASKGVLGLPDETRLAVTTVQSFFGTLGSLIIYGIVDESDAVAALGYRADLLWRKLEPFTLAERAKRGDDDFANFFEDFVYRTRLNWPPEKSYNLEIHRLANLSISDAPPEQKSP